jgi:hypothetical protein
MEQRDTVLEECEVPLDGNRFVDCTFLECTLVYRGGELPLMVNCRLDRCQIIFAGAAARAVEFATELYHGGGRTVVEATFDSIRRGPLRTGGSVH